MNDPTFKKGDIVLMWSDQDEKTAHRVLAFHHECELWTVAERDEGRFQIGVFEQLSEGEFHGCVTVLVRSGREGEFLLPDGPPLVSIEKVG